MASKSGSVLNRKRFAAGLAAGAEIEPPLPAALASRIDLGGIGGWARTGSAPMLDSLHASPYVPASRWHSSMWSANRLIDRAYRSKTKALPAPCEETSWPRPSSVPCTTVWS